MWRPHDTQVGLVLLLAFTGTAGAQPSGVSPPSSLMDVPVADMMIVAPAEYTKAEALAAGGSSPLQVALTIAGPFEGATQHVLQVNEGGEVPTSTRITVVRDGLLDDAVRGERWVILLDRAAMGSWHIREVRRAWRCHRGGHQAGFTTSLCP